MHQTDISGTDGRNGGPPAILARMVGAMLALVLLAGSAEPLPVTLRIPADEARQGAASNGRYVYAIDNSRIGKYRISDGRRVAQWSGDPVRFPHLNSCSASRRKLVCALSNYPAVPHANSVETFDARTLRHLGSRPLGFADGSLTTIERFGGEWWAVFAHYDGKGGVPGKDAAHSQLVRLDEDFKVTARWSFPNEVVARMRPYSISGASWSPGGQLALSGHSLPEIYIVSLPQAGNELELRATVPVASEGQAIDWDPKRPFALWTISRRDRALWLSDFAHAHGR